MPFTLKKKLEITDTIYLEDSKGKRTATIKVAIDPYTAALEFQRNLQVLEAARKNAMRSPANINSDMVGNAVLTLMKCVFGEENTQTLLAHYAGEPLELLNNIYPYIVETILPQMRDASKVIAGQVKSSVSAARKMRRPRWSRV